MKEFSMTYKAKVARGCEFVFSAPTANAAAICAFRAYFGSSWKKLSAERLPNRYNYTPEMNGAVPFLIKSNSLTTGIIIEVAKDNQKETVNAR